MGLFSSFRTFFVPGIFKIGILRYLFFGIWPFQQLYYPDIKISSWNNLKFFENKNPNTPKDSNMIVFSFYLWQGDVTTERHFFCLCPLKEGTYSVEYNSSLSPLQALSICISVVECRKSSQHITDNRTYVAKQVQDDPVPVRFASFPPLSPVGRV